MFCHYRSVFPDLFSNLCVTVQGLITYANEFIQNWFTTLADSFRVSDDMGKLRFQLKMFHKPLFGWKGSYVVTQVSSVTAKSQHFAH